jgi:hypothetical protein
MLIDTKKKQIAERLILAPQDSSENTDQEMNEL